MELGIIGLGKMGGNMAERLRLGGHKVVGFDFSAEAVKRLTAAGSTGVPWGSCGACCARARNTRPRHPAQSPAPSGPARSTADHHHHGLRSRTTLNQSLNADERRASTA